MLSDIKMTGSCGSKRKVVIDGASGSRGTIESVRKENIVCIAGRAVFGNAFSGCGFEQFCISDEYICRTLWDRRPGDVFSSAAIRRHVSAESDFGKQRVSAYGLSLYFPASLERISAR